MKLFHLAIAFLFAGIAQSQTNIDSLRNELNKAQKNENIEQQAWLNRQIGFAFKDGKNPLEAIPYLRKSIELFGALEDSKEQASDMMTLGLLYKNTKERDLSIVEFEKALKIYKKLNFKQGLAMCYANIGSYYRFVSNYEKALKTLQNAVAISTEIEDEHTAANCYGNLGNVYMDMGDLENASIALNKALELHKKLGMVKFVGLDYGNLAIIYSDQGSHLKALENHLKAYAIADSIGSLYSAGLSSENVAIELTELAQEYKNEPTIRDSILNKAFYYFNNSINICVQIHDEHGIASNASNLGNFFKSMAQYYKKESSSIHDSLINLSLMYILKADSMYTKLGRTYSITISKNSLASIYRIKGTLLEKGSPKNMELIDSSIYFSEQSYKLAKEIGAERRIGEALNHLPVMLWYKNDLKKSHQFFQEQLQLDRTSLKRNFSFISENDKENYLKENEDRTMIFYSFANVYKDKNPEIVDFVYDNVLFNKGLLLKSSTAMRNLILNSSDSTMIEEYNSWLELKKELDELYSIPAKFRKQNVQLLETKADSLETTLVRKSSDFSAFQKTLKSDWKEVKSNLKANEAAIEFVQFRAFDGQYKNEFNDKIIYCALILTSKSKHPEMVPLFYEEELLKIMDVFGGNNLKYVEELYGTNSSPKKELYDIIWKPLENYLNDINTIYYSPDGLLHKVSFSGIRNDQNLLLSSKYEMHRKGSTAGINHSELILNKGSNITIFGGINYDTGGDEHRVWSYLDGTKVESEKIEKLLRKKKFNVNLFKEFGATEDQFKKTASNSDIIHIATHGFFYPDPKKVMDQLEVTQDEIAFRGGGRGLAMNSYVKNENPMMRSGLVLANANKVWNQEKMEGEDGVLTALEVAHIDLRKTKLAVMSACETGLGDIHGSEGVYGLQRAFKMAGCQNIIMSLWQVPDKETSEFMSHFYEELTKGISISGAFVNTQRFYSKKYDPYFWAAFVLLQ
ncbi:MAG: CHAT domain-containing tetratricopeptide repeat protein [Crocinitomicaceae bacterium]